MSASILKTIYCQRSGVPLAQMELFLFEGHMAYMQAHDDSAVYLHPFFNMHSVPLLRKYEEAIEQAKDQGWKLAPHQQQRLQLLTSATLHLTNSIHQKTVGLPTFIISAGSATRVLGLVRWYLHVSSQRTQLPIFGVGKDNANWENLRHWLDACDEVHKEWLNHVRKIEREALQRLQSAAVKDIRSEHTRKVDKRKVWNWIKLQLEDGGTPEGRIVTFEDLFMNGDAEPEEWLSDDVDDLSEEILKHCDIGNEVMYWIQNRLNTIRSMIRDLYSGFTIIGRTLNEEEAEEQTQQEKDLFAEYDRQIEQMIEPPRPPQQSLFTTRVLFLKAQAEHRILLSRWKLMHPSAATQNTSTENQS